MSQLLQLTDAYLSAATPGRVRQTCWIARRGVEQLVERLLRAKNIVMPEATMTSKLITLQVLYDGTEVPRLAWHSWRVLSRACHQHAYELSPTYAEVAGWVEVVHQLAAEAYAAAKV